MHNGGLTVHFDKINDNDKMPNLPKMHDSPIKPPAIQYIILYNVPGGASLDSLFGLIGITLDFSVNDCDLDGFLVIGS